MEKHSPQPEKHYREAEGALDSPINTQDAHDYSEQSSSTDDKSLTNDESADTDPNQVADKATFRNKEDKTNPDRFDGEIKI